MKAENKPSFWTNTRVAILGICVTAITAVTVAWINGSLSKTSNSTPSKIQEIKTSLHLDSGVQNNTNNQVIQENNKGEINNEFVSGNKTTTNSNVKKTEIKGGVTNYGNINSPNSKVDNSKHIINGDVTIGQPLFSEEYAPRLLYVIDSVKAANNTNTKCVFILTDMQGNGQSFAEGLKLYLIKTGFAFRNTGIAAWNEAIQGIQISMHNDCVQIAIGNLNAK